MLIQKVHLISTISNSLKNVKFFLTAHLLGKTTVETKGTPLVLVKLEGWLVATTWVKLSYSPYFVEIASQYLLNKSVPPCLEEYFTAFNLFGVSFVDSIVCPQI